jgi:hypothetical protein
MDHPDHGHSGICFSVENGMALMLMPQIAGTDVIDLSAKLGMFSQQGKYPEGIC